MNKYERPSHIYFAGGPGAGHIQGVPMKAVLDLNGEESWVDDASVELALESGLYQRTKPSGATAEAASDALGISAASTVEMDSAGTPAGARKRKE